MTTGGENKSIWFDADRLAKIAALVAVYEERSGLPAKVSAIVGKAIDLLFLSECPPQTTNGDSKSHSIDKAA